MSSEEEEEQYTPISQEELEASTEANTSTTESAHVSHATATPQVGSTTDMSHLERGVESENASEDGDEAPQEGESGAYHSSSASIEQGAHTMQTATTSAMSTPHGGNGEQEESVEIASYGEETSGVSTSTGESETSASSSFEEDEREEASRTSTAASDTAAASSDGQADIAQSESGDTAAAPLSDEPSVTTTEMESDTHASNEQEHASPAVAPGSSGGQADTTQSGSGDTTAAPQSAGPTVTTTEVDLDTHVSNKQEHSSSTAATGSSDENNDVSHVPQAEEQRDNEPLVGQGNALSPGSSGEHEDASIKTRQMQEDNSSPMEGDRSEEGTHVTSDEQSGQRPEGLQHNPSEPLKESTSCSQSDSEARVRNGDSEDQTDAEEAPVRHSREAGHTESVDTSSHNVLDDTPTSEKASEYTENASKNDGTGGRAALSESSVFTGGTTSIPVRNGNDVVEGENNREAAAQDTPHSHATTLPKAASTVTTKAEEAHELPENQDSAKAAASRDNSTYDIDRHSADVDVSSAPSTSTTTRHLERSEVYGLNGANKSMSLTKNTNEHPHHNGNRRRQIMPETGGVASYHLQPQARQYVDTEEAKHADLNAAGESSSNTTASHHAAGEGETTTSPIESGTFRDTDLDNVDRSSSESSVVSTPTHSTTVRRSSVDTSAAGTRRASLGLASSAISFGDPLVVKHSATEAKTDREAYKPWSLIWCEDGVLASVNENDSLPSQTVLNKFSDRQLLARARSATPSFSFPVKVVKAGFLRTSRSAAICRITSCGVELNKPTSQINKSLSTNWFEDTLKVRSSAVSKLSARFNAPPCVPGVKAFDKISTHLEVPAYSVVSSSDTVEFLLKHETKRSQMKNLSRKIASQSFQSLDTMYPWWRIAKVEGPSIHIDAKQAPSLELLCFPTDYLKELQKFKDLLLNQLQYNVSECRDRRASIREKWDLALKHPVESLLSFLSEATVLCWAEKIANPNTPFDVSPPANFPRPSGLERKRTLEFESVAAALSFKEHYLREKEKKLVGCFYHSSVSLDELFGELEKSVSSSCWMNRHPIPLPLPVNPTISGRKGPRYTPIRVQESALFATSRSTQLSDKLPIALQGYGAKQETMYVGATDLISFERVIGDSVDRFDFERLSVLEIDAMVRLKSMRNALVLLRSDPESLSMGAVSVAAARRQKLADPQLTSLDTIPFGGSKATVLFFPFEQIDGFMDSLSSCCYSSYGVQIPEIQTDSLLDLYNAFSVSEGRGFQRVGSSEMSELLKSFFHNDCFCRRVSTSSMLLATSVVCSALCNRKRASGNLFDDLDGVIMAGGDALSSYRNFEEILAATKSRDDVERCIPRKTRRSSGEAIIEVDVGNGTFSQWSPYVQSVFEVWKLHSHIFSQLDDQGENQKRAYASLQPENVRALCDEIPRRSRRLVPAMVFTGDTSDHGAENSDLRMTSRYSTYAAVSPCLISVSATHLLEFDYVPVTGNKVALVLTTCVPLERIKSIVRPDAPLVETDPGPVHASVASEPFVASQMGLQWSDASSLQGSLATHFPLMYEAEGFATLTPKQQEELCTWTARLMQPLSNEGALGGSTYLFSDGLWGRRTSRWLPHKSFSTFSGFDDVSCCGLYIEEDSHSFRNTKTLSTTEAMNIFTHGLLSAQRNLESSMACRAPVSLPLSANALLASSLQESCGHANLDMSPASSRKKSLSANIASSSPASFLADLNEDSSNICDPAFREAMFACCLADGTISEWKLNGYRLMSDSSAFSSEHPMLGKFLRSTSTAMDSLKGPIASGKATALCLSKPLHEQPDNYTKGAILNSVATNVASAEGVDKLWKTSDYVRKLIHKNQPAKPNSKERPGKLRLHTPNVIEEIGTTAPGLKYHIVSCSDSGEAHNRMFVSPEYINYNSASSADFVGFDQKQNTGETVDYSSVVELMKSLSWQTAVCPYSRSNGLADELSEVLENWEDKLPTAQVVEGVVDSLLLCSDRTQTTLVDPLLRILTACYGRLSDPHSHQGCRLTDIFIVQKELCSYSKASDQIAVDLMTLLQEGCVKSFKSWEDAFFCNTSVENVADLLVKATTLLEAITLSEEGYEELRKRSSKYLKHSSNLVKSSLSLHKEDGVVAGGRPSIEFLTLLKCILCARYPARDGQKVSLKLNVSKDSPDDHILTGHDDLYINSDSSALVEDHWDPTLIGHSAPIQSFTLRKSEIAAREALVKHLDISQIIADYISVMFEKEVAVGSDHMELLRCAFEMFAEGLCQRSTNLQQTPISSCLQELFSGGHSKQLDQNKLFRLWQFVVVQIAELLLRSTFTDLLASYAEFAVGVANYLYTLNEPLLWAEAQEQCMQSGLLHAILRYLLDPYAPLQSHGCGRHSLLRLLRVLCRQSINIKHLLYRLFPGDLLPHPVWREVRNDTGHIIGYASAKSPVSHMDWESIDHGFAGELEYHLYATKRKMATTTTISHKRYHAQKAEGTLAWKQPGLSVWLAEQIYKISEEHVGKEAERVSEVFDKGLQITNLSKSNFGSTKTIPVGDSCLMIDWLSSPLNYARSSVPLWSSSWCYSVFQQLLGYLTRVEAGEPPANMSFGADFCSCSYPIYESESCTVAPLNVSGVNILKILRFFWLSSDVRRKADMFRVLLKNVEVFNGQIRASWEAYQRLHSCCRHDTDYLESVLQRRMLLVWLRIAIQVLSWNDSSLNRVQSSVERAVAVSSWQHMLLFREVVNDKDSVPLSTSTCLRFVLKRTTNWSSTDTQQNAEASEAQAVAPPAEEEEGNQEYLPRNGHGESILDVRDGLNGDFRCALDQFSQEEIVPAGLAELSLALHDIGTQNTVNLTFQDSSLKEERPESDDLCFSISASSNVVGYGYEIACWLWQHTEDNLPEPWHPPEQAMLQYLAKGTLPRELVDAHMLVHLKDESIPQLAASIVHIQSRLPKNVHTDDFEGLKMQLVEICEQLLVCDAGIFSVADMKRFFCSDGLNVLVQLLHCAVTCSTLSPLLPSQSATRFPSAGLASVKSIPWRTSAQRAAAHGLHLVNIIMILLNKFISFSDFPAVCCDQEVALFFSQLLSSAGQQFVSELCYVLTVHNEVLKKIGVKRPEAAELASIIRGQVFAFNDLCSAFFFRLLRFCGTRPSDSIQTVELLEHVEVLSKSVHPYTDEIISVGSLFLHRYARGNEISSAHDSSSSFSLISVRWGAIIYGCRSLKNEFCSTLPAVAGIEDIFFFGCRWRESLSNLLGTVDDICCRVESLTLGSLKCLARTTATQTRAPSSAPRSRKPATKSATLPRSFHTSAYSESLATAPDSVDDEMPHRRRRPPRRAAAPVVARTMAAPSSDTESDPEFEVDSPDALERTHDVEQ
eukprot:gb/GECG01015780.1/.p1 GENE.gb/GECG01015780.1/~~gb/GECG01015780.1/.p1  ORF type:complete len:3339 (+),score=385.60 gb/GECG01015780.1/:1-10017(+)